MKLDPNTTVREFAVQVPAATRVFEKLGIDYCCGGGKSLREACTKAGIAVEDVLRGLQEGGIAQSAASNSLQDAASADLAAIMDHIVTKHHGYVKQEIPRIQQLASKVVSVHGKAHPELARIQDTFHALSAELTSHMMKEEQVLFPYIAELEEAIHRGEEPRPPMFGTVSNPVHMMEMEHDSAGVALATMREASGGYIAPDDACFSYKTLYSALQEFEQDLHQHIHLENNILFPRAIELEKQGAKVSL